MSSACWLEWLGLWGELMAAQVTGGNQAAVLSPSVTGL